MYHLNLGLYEQRPALRFGPITISPNQLYCTVEETESILSFLTMVLVNNTYYLQPKKQADEPVDRSDQ